MAAASFLAKAGGAVLAFLVTLLVARALGPAQTGVYLLALQIALVFSVLARRGADLALMRAVATQLAAGAQRPAVAVVRWCAGMVTRNALLAAACLLALAVGLRFYPDATPGLSGALMVFALCVLPMSLYNLLAEAIKGAGHGVAGTTVQTVVPAAATLLVLVLLSDRLTVHAAAIAVTGGAVLGLAAAGAFWHRTLGWRAPACDRQTRDRVRAGLGPLFWIAIMNLVMGSTDILMLGALSDTGQVGLYGVAARIVLVSGMLLTAVNGIYGPVFAGLWSRNLTRELGDLARRLTRWLVLCAVAFLVLVLTLGAWILAWFGPGFDDAYLCLALLGIAQFAVLATGPVAYLLMMTGHERLHRNTTVIAAVLNVGLNAVLIPLYGAAGAAAATGASLVVKNALAVHYVRSALKIRLYG